ncbi:MAG: hypothetical protein NTY19_04430 [Planctomycetota bacterium]|nr:hypothetical protein [Planctomycetota bacterium]
MLVIRHAQMTVFGREAQARFEEGLVELFLRHYPRECRQAGGQAQIRQLVRQGVHAAAVRGYSTKRQVSVYVSLTFILGADFVHDPQLPWVADCLSEDAIADPTLRLDNLFKETLDYLGATAGEHAEWIVRAMLRIRAFDLATVPDSQGDQWIADVCEILKGFYPQKFEHQGAEATRVMIADGIVRAAEYGLQHPRGVFVFVTLMFMLGSGFDRDPLHPWASAVLQDASLADETDRALRMHAQALTHIEQSLSPD